MKNCVLLLNILADVVSSRPFPKSSRKREQQPIGGGGGSGASNFSKYDQPRKSFAQKGGGKSFDKRPKFKGHHNGGPKEDSKVSNFPSF